MNAINLKEKLSRFSDRLFVVPKGLEHKPFAKSECSVMLVEPRGVVNTGESGGALTAANDVWI